MKLDLLFAREPFSEIFNETFGRYLGNRFGWTGSITWHTKVTKTEYLLVNSKLNVIYPDNFETSALHLLAAEYVYNPNVIRRLFQGIYVKYAVSKVLRKLFSTGRISITPYPPEIVNWCILPGNRTIRIIDWSRDECVILSKSCFDQEQFKNLVHVRQEISDLPGPLFLEANITEGWYREQRVSGLPINRLEDEVKVDEALSAARDAMVTLYQRTVILKNPVDWLEECTVRIDQLVKQLPSSYGPSFRNKIKVFVGFVKTKINLMFGVTESVKVKTVISHGDFQAANILSPVCDSKDAVYLIDWEYAGRKCLWYDALVFDLQARNPKGLAKRIMEWQEDSSLQLKSLSWCGAENMNWDPKAYIMFFLLDDLIMRLLDSNVPGLVKEDIGFIIFIDQLTSLKETVA